MKQMKRKIIRMLFAFLLLLSLVLLSGCGEPSGSVEDSPRLFSLGKPGFSVRFLTPGGETVQNIAEGSTVLLEEPAPREGYTFIGWKDEQNRIEQRDSVVVRQNLSYTAVYMPALGREAHDAYLFADAYGLFRPDAAMTRGDAAIMLCSLLNDPPKGESAFLDVPADAACYEAVSSLKALGVIGGSRFHPDEGITRAELLELLCAFYPAAKNNYDFAELGEEDSRYPLFCTAAERGWIESGPDVEALPDSILTRRETAQWMNRVLGRHAVRAFSGKEVGVLPDIPEDDPAYGDLAEACVSHRCRNTGETEQWTGSTPVSRLDEGLHLFGLTLYAIGTDGCLVRSDSYGGFCFDKAGVYTSENEELDTRIRSIFDDILDPSMERQDMLRVCYLYVVQNSRYLSRGVYEYGDMSWVTDEALTMLSTRKGNCYGFAAAFCMMARALGYDAQCYNGFISYDFTTHAWVEIEIDGTVYTFDPEIEYADELKYMPSNMYMMDPDEAFKWHYVH